MDLSWWLDQIVKNWDAVERTPMPFIAALFLGAAIGWMGIAMIHRERLSLWKDLVTEYKDKLKGASPTDAAAKIEELERRLERSQQRTITDQQGGILRSRLANWPFVALYNGANAEAENYARLLQGYLRGILQIHGRGEDEVPLELEGIYLRVKSQTAMPIRARIISDALHAAGIDHKIADEPAQDPPLHEDYGVMIIGRKAV